MKKTSFFVVAFLLSAALVGCGGKNKNASTMGNNEMGSGSGSAMMGSDMGSGSAMMGSDMGSAMGGSGSAM